MPVADSSSGGMFDCSIETATEEDDVEDEEEGVGCEMGAGAAVAWGLL